MQIIEYCSTSTRWTELEEWIPVLSVVNLKLGIFPVIDHSPIFPALVIPEQQFVDKVLYNDKTEMIGMADQSVGAFENRHFS